MKTSEFALQERNEFDKWITQGRHPNASEAVEALLDGKQEPPAGRYRVIEVNPFQVVPVGLPDPRNEHEIEYATVAFEWPGLARGLFDG